MTQTQSDTENQSFDAEVGRLLLSLAEEWTTVQSDRSNSTHSSGVLRDIFGALALQLGVRAKELRGTGAASNLAGILNDFKQEFAEAAAKVVR